VGREVWGVGREVWGVGRGAAPVRDCLDRAPSGPSSCGSSVSIGEAEHLLRQRQPTMMVLGAAADTGDPPGAPRRRGTKGAMSTPLAETSCAMRVDDWPESPYHHDDVMCISNEGSRGEIPRAMNTFDIRVGLPVRHARAVLRVRRPKAIASNAARDLDRRTAREPTAWRLVGAANRRLPGGRQSAGGETARGRLGRPGQIRCGGSRARSGAQRRQPGRRDAVGRRPNRRGARPVRRLLRRRRGHAFRPWRARPLHRLLWRRRLRRRRGHLRRRRGRRRVAVLAVNFYEPLGAATGLGHAFSSVYAFDKDTQGWNTSSESTMGYGFDGDDALSGPPFEPSARGGSRSSPRWRRRPRRGRSRLSSTAASLGNSYCLGFKKPRQYACRIGFAGAHGGRDARAVEGARGRGRRWLRGANFDQSGVCAGDPARARSRSSR
jgi:hypothetical protein